MAEALADVAGPVHVWSPAAEELDCAIPGVSVHRDCGTFGRADLRRMSEGLSRTRANRRLFVQWVPQGFGKKSLNVMFAFWLARRATREGDELHVMIHEPFLQFSLRPKRFVAALAHRVMLYVACRHAARVWLSIPGWMALVRPYVPRDTPIQWLPIPAPDLPVASEAVVAALRTLLAPERQQIVGHFGTYSTLIAPILTPALDVILASSDAVVLLMGHGSEGFAASFLATRPSVASRVRATGTLDPRSLAAHVQLCDIMVQPYPDGVSARRTSTLALMAAAAAIVSNTGWLSEPFWTEDRAIALAEGPTGSSIGDLAVRILLGKTERQRLSTAAANVYARRFHIRHSLAALATAS